VRGPGGGAGGGRGDGLGRAPAGARGGRAGIARLAARKTADALRDRRRIGDGHHDVLDAAADLVGDDLRQRGARALPLVGGAGRDRDLAVGEDAHADTLERAEAGALAGVGEADADIAALGQRPGLAFAKRLVARQLDRPRLALREIAAVIDDRLAVAEDHRDFVRHPFGPDDIAAAHLDTVELQLARD